MLRDVPRRPLHRIGDLVQRAPSRANAKPKAIHARSVKRTRSDSPRLPTGPCQRQQTDRADRRNETRTDLNIGVWSCEPDECRDCGGDPQRLCQAQGRELARRGTSAPSSSRKTAAPIPRKTPALCLNANTRAVNAPTKKRQRARWCSGAGGGAGNRAKVRTYHRSRRAQPARVRGTNTPGLSRVQEGQKTPVWLPKTRERVGGRAGIGRRPAPGAYSDDRFARNARSGEA